MHKQTVCIFKTIYFTIVIVIVIATSSAGAVTLDVINPNDDGTIYGNGSVNNNVYVQAAGPLRGILEFSMEFISSYVGIDNISLYLTVNPYGLPIRDYTIDLYGYESTDGILTSSDYNAGTFLGYFVLPVNLDFGEDAYFDVTSYLSVSVK